MKRASQRLITHTPLLILIIAFLIRLWGLDANLPYIYHPDEPTYLRISQTIFTSGDLNPHFFHFPSLLFYLNAIAYIPFYAIGNLLGLFSSFSDLVPPTSLTMGVSQTAMPATVLLNRSVTAIFGTGSVGLIYLIGKDLNQKKAVGILSAAIYAILPLPVLHSRFVTPDTFVTFFILATCLMSLCLFRQGQQWQYIAAGICVGLTASSKYNGAIVLSVVIAAHFLRTGWAGCKDYKIMLALLFSGLAFITFTPYALLDYAAFSADMQFEAQHYSTGHIGMDGDTLRWYVSFLWTMLGGINVLAILAIIRGLWLRHSTLLLLAVFPVLYFLFINQFIVRNGRTALHLMPFLVLLATSLFVDFFTGVNRHPKPLKLPLLSLGIIGFFFISYYKPVMQTIQDTTQLTSFGSREVASEWVSTNLPSGARIALESYSPFVEPDQFSVRGFFKIIDHPPEWYIDHNYEYLIFSNYMFARYYREPEQYTAEVSQYDAFFSRFNLVKTFFDGDLEIRLYQIVPDE